MLSEKMWVYGVLVDLNSYPAGVSGHMAVGEEMWVEAHLDDEIQHVRNIVTSVISSKGPCWQPTDWCGSMISAKRSLTIS